MKTRVITALAFAVALVPVACFPASIKHVTPSPSPSPALHPVVKDGDVIDCPVNLMCEVAFGPMETLTGTVRHGGDPKDWVVIADHGPPSQVMVRPLRAGAFTDIVMPTTEGLHIVYFRGVSATQQPVADALVVEFAPPPPPMPKIVIVRAPAATPTPQPQTLLSFVDMHSFHCDASDSVHPAVYRIEGTASFRPTRVCVDKTKTYIEIPANSVLPALAEQGPHGEIVFVEPHFQDNVFVDVAHREHYVLIYGTGKDAQQVHIDRVPGSVIVGAQ
jgi:hypothetical protein